MRLVRATGRLLTLSLSPSFVCCSVYNTTAISFHAVDAILESAASAGATAAAEGSNGMSHVGIDQIQEALNTCVAAVNADTSNYEYSKKLLDLLQVVIDDDRRLTLFQSAARGLLDAGNREQASILAFNLAESMDDREKNIDQRSADFKAVQYKFFRQSIRIFPDNPIAARSLGYRLEQTGEEEEAMQLYRESLARSAPAWRLDLLLLLASTCSPFLAVAEQGDERYSRIYKGMQQLVKEVRARHQPFQNLLSPARHLVYMPSFSWQYLGRNMRPLMEALCWILAAMAAGLHDASPALHPDKGWGGWVGIQGAEERYQQGAHLSQGGVINEEETAAPMPKKRSAGSRILLGVIMERSTNHSPHRLMQTILEGFDRSRFRLVVFSHAVQDMAKYPPAGRAVFDAADEIITLPWHPFVEGLPDTFAERAAVAEAKVDVLLYMALGNTLGSHLLALGRLAPVQVAFGHGHPVTSGSPAIDYFVSSDRFETALSIDAREARRIAGTASTIVSSFTAAAATTSTTNFAASGADTLPPKGHSSATACGIPAEVTRGHQGVKIFQPSPSGYRGVDDVREDIEVEWGRGDGSQDYTEQLVLFDSSSASMPESYGPLNSPEVSAADVREFTGLRDGDRAYHCIQHSKKMHPDFDAVMRGVLTSDPAAKILLSEGSKIHLHRWGQTLGSDLVSRLVFLPYLPHPEILMIVAECSVMLDTFPWGGGVTSFEAFAAGVPVVSAPSKVSVLQLAAGQISALGLENELLAADVDDMVRKAVALASDSAYRENVLDYIFQRKDRLSDPRRVIEEWELFLERAVRSAIP